jgi:hypothetical protein
VPGTTLPWHFRCRGLDMSWIQTNSDRLRPPPNNSPPPYNRRKSSYRRLAPYSPYSLPPSTRAHAPTHNVRQNQRRSTLKRRRQIPPTPRWLCRPLIHSRAKSSGDTDKTVFRDGVLRDSGVRGGKSDVHRGRNQEGV